MRRGIFIAGIAVLVVGVLLLALGYFLVSAQQSVTIPIGSALQLTPTGIGSGSLSVSWSGAPAATKLYLTSAQPACPNPSGVLGNGSGASGSFSASLSSGSSYWLFICGTAQSVPVTYSVSGISYLMLIGIVLAILGAVIAALGVRARPKVVPMMEEPMAEAEPGELPPYVVPPPITPEMAPSAPTPTVIGVRAQPPEPTRFMPASEPTANTMAPRAGGARANVTCSFCGTVNEPWITNCRKCKRPLSSTGTS
jgi:uncharacterized membrane protein